MTALAIHVTEARGSVAVERRDGAVLASEFAAQGDKAPVLLVEIEQLLRRAETPLSAVETITVTTGPGSLTGIRVGIATAQGLALARGARVLACDSLQAVAAAHRDSEPAVAVVLDARRGEVYAAVYDLPSRGPLGVRLAPGCWTPAAAAAAIAAMMSGEARPRLAGSGASLVETPLRASIASLEIVTSSTPIAAAVLDLARRDGLRTVAAAQLEPVYLRLSDAEARRANDA
jgi:tRNA threonylcarbamoyl adenosine modification protein YeaZ